MKRVVTLWAVMLLVLVASSYATILGFTRADSIAIPEATLNNGGVGNMIVGQDVDGDGKLDVYLVNDNWNDGATELIPRIYKLEKNGANWEVVWQATSSIPKQNTWPQLAITDLDKDGKKELLWAIINFTDATNLNPPRIVAYEQVAPNSDIFGVSDGAGGYRPNAQWSIADIDSTNIRPMDWEIVDIDNDGTDEIVFADRVGANSGSYGLYFGVVSVSNIPDNGDGSEVWTMETSGKDLGVTTAAENKWDVAVIGPRAYFFSETEITKLIWDGSSWDFESLNPLAGGSMVQSARTVDLDKDGTKEIFGAVYDWGNDAYKGIYLLQEVADTLKATEIFNLSKYWPTGSRGPWGSACGDIDGDGNLDFVFGSRNSTPNAAIFLCSYKGGDITNPANYELMMIDSLYSSAANTGIWSVLDIANLDDDPELEVVYTSSASYGGDLFNPAHSAPLIILDPTVAPSGLDSLAIASEVLFNGAPPTGMIFKPGRILDGGNIIWFVGVNSSAKETYAFRSIDGGKTFTHNSTAIAGRAAQIDAFDANTALVVTAEGKIWKTSDGGQTWIEKHSYVMNPILGGAGWFDGVRVVDDNIAVAYGDMENDGDMYFVRSTDKGENWTRITGIDYKRSCQGIYSWGTAACNIGPSIWFTGTTLAYDTAYVFRSYDGGVTWESFKVDPALAKQIRAITFYDNDHGMAVGKGGAPFATSDGGATWSVCTMPASGTNWINAVVAIPNTNIIMGFGDAGEVFYTEDLGSNWNTVTVPAAAANDDFLGAVLLNRGFGYCFTYQGKVLRFANQKVSAIRPEPAIEILADKFTLFQNYPNPFNPSTRISFELRVNTPVRLTIYDVLGREVVMLVNEQLSAGRHEYVWNGQDKNGAAMPTGIYLYELKTGNITRLKKMTLVK